MKALLKNSSKIIPIFLGVFLVTRITFADTFNNIIIQSEIGAEQYFLYEDNRVPIGFSEGASYLPRAYAIKFQAPANEDICATKLQIEKYQTSSETLNPISIYAALYDGSTATPSLSFRSSLPATVASATFYPDKPTFLEIPLTSCYTMTAGNYYFILISPNFGYIYNVWSLSSFSNFSAQYQDKAGKWHVSGQSGSTIPNFQIVNNSTGGELANDFPQGVFPGSLPNVASNSFNCGSLDLPCQFSSGMTKVGLYLFSPTQQSLDNFKNIPGYFSDKIPFSYFYQISSISEGFSVTVSTSMPLLQITGSDIRQYGASISDITIMSGDMLQHYVATGSFGGLTLLGLFKTTAEYVLWVSFVLYIWKRRQALIHK